jgi:hypothetical protein
MTRAGTVLAAVALVAALTAVGISAIRGRTPARFGRAPVAVRVAQDSVTLAGEAIADGAIAPAADEHKKKVIAPVLPSGRTTLPDSAVVTVSDSVVAVDFDEIMLRTRRPAKFERFLRETLPVIYGAPMRHALDALPDGSIASQGDLLTELPRTGVRIPLDDGHVMTVWPETRPGEDGPLVIRFRVTVS